MKVLITYEYDYSYSHKFFAKAPKYSILACGKSFEEAKDKLIHKVQDAYSAKLVLVPPDEEIEIDFNT